jgi:hypothetical protein
MVVHQVHSFIDLKHEAADGSTLGFARLPKREVCLVIAWRWTQQDYGPQVMLIGSSGVMGWCSADAVCPLEIMRGA